jgi:hypothetical protein
MPRGSSGRIVLVVDPSIKDDLYIALAKRKLTLKGWFLIECEQFIYSTNQPNFINDMVSEPKFSYNRKQG